jgi:hypothetical protein
VATVAAREDRGGSLYRRAPDAGAGVARHEPRTRVEDHKNSRAMPYKEKSRPKTTFS